MKSESFVKSIVFRKNGAIIPLVLSSNGKGQKVSFVEFMTLGNTYNAEQSYILRYAHNL